MTPNTTSDTKPQATEHTARAIAHPNIALVKYWGKRDPTLNLPAVGSVSITLDTLTTTTRAILNSSLSCDQFELNQQTATPAQSAKFSEIADIFRKLAGVQTHVAATSQNNFPTAAGLASSASGYAALVVTLNHVYQTSLSLPMLSRIARMGSGSAARSIFGGFAQMHLGERADGEDAVATSVLERVAWPLEVIVAVTSEQAKTVSSTVGMEATRTTSPFYTQWVDTQQSDIQRALDAIEQRDFNTLSDVSEYSCLKMHGLMLSANPGLLYWNATTVACLHAVRQLRNDGVPVFFTIDAGPQVKAICAPGFGNQVAACLGELPGVHRIIRAGLGEGAKLVAKS